MNIVPLIRAFHRSFGRIDFGALNRLEPVSRKFGFDRGTPIDRVYIERFLEANRDMIRGAALEVADTSYVVRFGADRVARATALDGRADLGIKETLPDAEFDCFVCTQTLNFIFDVGAALAGCRHVLKAGGVLMGTVAGTSQTSRYDAQRWGDYWRMSPMAMERLLVTAGFIDIRITPFGNLVAAIALLQGIAAEELPDRELLAEYDPDYVIVTGFVARRPG
jgi:hypothetical protein